MRRSVLIPVLLALAAAPAAAQSLSTTFASNNGGSSGWGVFFDLTVLNPNGVRITALDVNVSSTVNTAFSLDVYLTPVTYAGKDTNGALWIKASYGHGVAAGRNLPSRVEIADLPLGPGSYGIALYHNNASPAYTNGTGSNQKYANADIQLDLGLVHSTLWGGSLFNSRVWNGTVYYAQRNAAVFGTYGLPCKGTGGDPAMAAAPGSLPKPNTTFQVDMTGLPAATGPAYMVLGFGRGSIGPVALPFDLTPLGFAGCNLMVQITFLTNFPNINGKGFWVLGIPNDVNLIGGAFFIQGLIFDPKANPAGFTLSAAGEGQIGL